MERQYEADFKLQSAEQTNQANLARNREDYEQKVRQQQRQPLEITTGREGHGLSTEPYGSAGVDRRIAAAQEMQSILKDNRA